MGAMQAWFPEGTNLAGLAVFLTAMVVSFLAGYLAGRGARPRPAQPPAHRQRPAALSRQDVLLPPLPVLGIEEATLMDLTTIRRAESEPPPPIDPATPATDAPTSRESSGAASDQLRLPMAGHRPGAGPRQRPMGRPNRKPA